MAAKKKAKSKVAARAKVAGKQAVKKTVRKAKTLLGRIAQKSAQLVIASGVLGKLPDEKPAKKKRASKA